MELLSSISDTVHAHATSERRALFCTAIDAHVHESECRARMLMDGGRVAAPLHACVSRQCMVQSHRLPDR